MGRLFSFSFLGGAHPQHMEVPRRGWIGAVAAGLHHSRSNPIRASSATYTTAHGNARWLTQWVRPGIKPTTSWIQSGSLTTEPGQELQEDCFLTNPRSQIWPYLRVFITQQFFPSENHTYWSSSVFQESFCSFIVSSNFLLMLFRVSSSSCWLKRQRDGHF